jgi:hypothetical protein
MELIGYILNSFMISVFRRDVDDNCAPSFGNPLPTFRDNVWVPSSGVSKSNKMGPIRYTETSVKDYHLTLRNLPAERSCHFFSSVIRIVKIELSLQFGYFRT